MDRISVVVKPGAKHEKVEETGPGRYVVWVRARPREGRANDAVIALLGSFFDIPKSSLAIIRGQHARTKIITIATN